MDSYRGDLGQFERANLLLHGADAGPGADPAVDDHIALQPPPASVGQDERRMQVRAYNYWASLLGDRPFPCMKDVVAAELPDFADHAVVLDFSKTIANPAIAMLGATLADECGVATSIKRLSEVPGGSLLSRITDHCKHILANEAPIGFEAEFVNQRGKTLLYRSILLPFSSNGKDIQHILGVVNWKEVADPSITAELRQELEIAVGITTGPLSSPALGTWADGPAAVGPGERDAPVPHPSQSADRELADWLTAARDSAEVAAGLEERSRAALYTAIGRAWDLALAAKARAPLMPLVTLVFGAAYDRPRLAEFATVLAHARRLEVERGTLAAVLAEQPGGMQRIVCEERAWHRTKRQGRRNLRM